MLPCCRPTLPREMLLPLRIVSLSTVGVLVVFLWLRVPPTHATVSCSVVVISVRLSTVLELEISCGATASSLIASSGTSPIPLLLVLVRWSITSSIGCLFLMVVALTGTLSCLGGSRGRSPLLGALGVAKPLVIRLTDDAPLVRARRTTLLVILILMIVFSLLEVSAFHNALMIVASDHVCTASNWLW